MKNGKNNCFGRTCQTEKTNILFRSFTLGKSGETNVSSVKGELFLKGFSSVFCINVDINLNKIILSQKMKKKDFMNKKVYTHNLV